MRWLWRGQRGRGRRSRDSRNEEEELDDETVIVEQSVLQVEKGKIDLDETAVDHMNRSWNRRRVREQGFRELTIL